MKEFVVAAILAFGVSVANASSSIIAYCKAQGEFAETAVLAKHQGISQQRIEEMVLEYINPDIRNETQAVLRDAYATPVGSNPALDARLKNYSVQKRCLGNMGL